MIPFSIQPTREINYKGKTISCFSSDADKGEVVNSFSSEWKKFNRFSEEEIKSAGDQYFDIVTSEMLNKNSSVLDVGCGSGRWTRYAADKAGFVEGIDLIESIDTAVELNLDKKNVRISQASVNNIPFADNSFDFVFCLGVLHHLPNTEEALNNVIKKLKTGGHCLIYLYYKIEESSFFIRTLFLMANFVRIIVSRLPDWLKLPICDLIAFAVYLPFVLITKFVLAVSPNSGLYKNIPLYYYADKSFKIIRNDSLDRFGTTIEKRFSKKEIEVMMKNSGLEQIAFSEHAPFWHAVGRKNNTV